MADTDSSPPSGINVIYHDIAGSTLTTEPVELSEAKAKALLTAFCIGTGFKIVSGGTVSVDCSKEVTDAKLRSSTNLDNMSARNAAIDAALGHHLVVDYATSYERPITATTPYGGKLNLRALGWTNQY